MKVRFNDGPLDGRTEEVADEETERGIIYWPPGALDRAEDDDAVPGLDGVVEYVYRGDGTADYVSGFLGRPDEGDMDQG